MGYYVPLARFERILAAMKNDYTIYGPKQVARPGQTEESAAAEIIWDKPSAFSPKEVLYPIVQTLLYFNGGICKEHALSPAKSLLVFCGPAICTAIRRIASTSV